MQRKISHKIEFTPGYNTWRHMRRRCTDPKCPNYEAYGGRGIKVCKRWDSFENFIADMGERPEGLTLDRKDNDGNYEPGNCRWATPKEQQNNRRDNRVLMFDGVSMTIAQWTQRLGWKHRTIYDRIDRLGWTVERALSTPVRAIQNVTKD